ncbi:sugar transferase [Streptococcus suis]|uniref:sugar transferase n=1 Tax=Streptococcus suis TaxID=1307 RepID=UPI0037BA4749
MKLYLIVKRIFDILVSVVGIVVLSPVLLLTYLAIKLDSPGPAIFKQKRLGRYGKEFTVYKFRSMTVGAEKMESGQYSFEGDPRVTKVGNFIRKTSIDELPQFINILKGDMSLIGFRPPLTYHPKTFEEYTDAERVMFSLRPGVTGWAQIHGRKTVNWNERIQMNIWYANNISFWLDVKIFFTTIIKVLKNEDNINTNKTV